MERPTGARPAFDRALRAAREGLRGLVTVLVRADPVPAWRSPWQRRAVYAGLAAGTLTCCAASLASVAALTSEIHLDAAIARVPARTPKWSLSVPAGVKQIPQTHINVYGPPPIIHGASFGVSPGLLATLGGSIVLAVLVALVVVAPLPLAARYPLMGWRIGWLGLVMVPLAHVTWTDHWPWDPTQLFVVMVVFCVAGVRVGRVALWWMWALTLVAWWLQAWDGQPGLMPAVAGSVVVSVAAVAAGVWGAWRGARQALVSQAEQTELEQARRAVLEERAKIARELHDVVAHHMSLIAVRAETAPYRLAGLGEPVVAEFASLSGGARAALSDMRRLLGVLRHDEPGLLAPQPQLADLPALIEGARRAGVGVALRAGGVAGEVVPPPVGVCAYRIVQESLSNASRHAPGSPVTVWVSHDQHTVLLRVENGPAATHPMANGHISKELEAVNGNAASERSAAVSHATVNGPASGGPAINRHGAVSQDTAAGGPGTMEGQTGVNGSGAMDTQTVANGCGAMDTQTAANGQGSMNGLAPDGGSGHGLAGMRERVALLGGTLSAGPSPEGGFIVSAVLPLGEAA